MPAKKLPPPLHAVKTIAAISDAAGPDPRAYTYDLKPAEEAIYRNKMLELASRRIPAEGHAAAPKNSDARGRNANIDINHPERHVRAKNSPQRPPSPSSRI